MFELFNFAKREQGMLPEHRSAGLLPWLIAIMLFLTALACWAGFSLAGATSRLASDLDNRLTIQVIEPNPALRTAQVKALLAELGKLTAIAKAEAVSDEDLAKMLDPWLGETARDADLPMPALIDVTLSGNASLSLDQFNKAVTDIAPTARVAADAEWLKPATQLLSTLQWLSLGLVLLMAAATGAVVVMAVRSSLNTHGETIDIMHLMGASDRQVAQLFERQIARDALLGGIVGLMLALLVIIPLSSRISGLGGGLPGEGSTAWWSLPLLLLLPLFGVGFSRLVARRTVMRTLEAKL